MKVINIILITYIILKIDTICSEDVFLIEGTIGPDGIQSHNQDLTQKKTRSYPDIKKPKLKLSANFSLPYKSLHLNRKSSSLSSKITNNLIGGSANYDLQYEAIVRNKLVRKKRQESDDRYIDYVLLDVLNVTLTGLQEQNVAQLNGSIVDVIFTLLREYAVNTEYYHIITHIQEDNIGVCDFLSTIKWWRIEIPLPGSDTNVRILDLMLETPLRYCYRWLCENHYLISRRSPNELAGFGLRILQQQDFYRILTEGEDEVTDLERSLSRHNWWTQEGEIDVEDGQLTWST